MLHILQLGEGEIIFLEASCCSYGPLFLVTRLIPPKKSRTFIRNFMCNLLIDCSDFRDIRNKYFVASTMKDVFEQVSMNLHVGGLGVMVACC